MTIESPLLRFEERGVASERVIGVGAEPFISYVEFSVVFAPPITELSDNEVLQLAESSNSLALLDSPDEDIYNDLLKSKE